MTQNFEVLPVYSVLPGTVVHSDGVVFSTVFRDCTSCGLILYRLKDLTKTIIPFTDEFRFGSLYSVMVRDLSPSEWGYLYYRDDKTFIDPYARELEYHKTPEGGLTVCRLYPEPENDLRPSARCSGKCWQDGLIYCMHVRGFTASRTSRAAGRGTFRAAAAKIPYLKSLGVTMVELLPVYEHKPEKRSAAGAEEKKENYWNFGEGYYFAPKKSYSSTGDPQREFREMIKSFHDAGIRVILQLHFPDSVSIQTQLETARFYASHYHVDGFHLKGSDHALRTIATDPLLSDTALFYEYFPYGDITGAASENPAEGRPDARHLAEYGDRFLMLSRRFIKSDNQVMTELAGYMTDVPSGHGRVHFAANYDTFTLLDTVSYNWKHNEENGENNTDGRDENYSWNCGVEGPSGKKAVRQLRLRQIRNLLALTFLSQGTPLLYAGDERCNSQGGNNNPYCQDNETGWMTWRDTADAKNILSFTKMISEFRRDHSIFRMDAPFKFKDYKAFGCPDLSFHGQEAWKPDPDKGSLTIGILYNELYGRDPREELVYLGINMHWHSRQLGVPTPPKGFRWRLVMDTFEEESFPKEAVYPEDQRHLTVRGRSIRILVTERIPGTDKTKEDKTEDERKDHGKKGVTAF